MSSPTVDDISAYAEWLIAANLAPSTIKNLLSAVKILYTWWQKHHIVKLFQSDAWSLTLRGITNSVRPSQTNKSTISIQDLIIIIQSCSFSLDLLPFKVGILLGFFGFLRVSNLAPPKVSDWDPSRHTTWDDVHVSDKGILFKIRWSKTRQSSSDSAVIPLPALGSSPLCPLRAWLLYQAALEATQLQTPTPLLVAITGSPGTPLTIPKFRAGFHQIMAAAGLSDRGYTPHSLRRGGASFLHQAGVLIPHIKTHGTWRSDAINAYLLSQPRFDTPIAKAFTRLLRNVKLVYTFLRLVHPTPTFGIFLVYFQNLSLCLSLGSKNSVAFSQCSDITYEF